MSAGKDKLSAAALRADASALAERVERDLEKAADSVTGYDFESPEEVERAYSSAADLARESIDRAFEGLEARDPGGAGRRVRAETLAAVAARCAEMADVEASKASASASPERSRAGQRRTAFEEMEVEFSAEADATMRAGAGLSQPDLDAMGLEELDALARRVRARLDRLEDFAERVERERDLARGRKP